MKPHTKRKRQGDALPELCLQQLLDLIHGGVLRIHNLLQGSIIIRRLLAQYRELDCLKESLLISWDTISGDDAALYAVFSVFDASMLPDSEDYFYLRRFDELRSGGDEAMQLLIDELRERSLYDVPIDVAPQDGLLALVTCSYSNSDGRLMVFARRLRAGESA